MLLDNVLTSNYMSETKLLQNHKKHITGYNFDILEVSHWAKLTLKFKSKSNTV